MPQISQGIVNRLVITGGAGGAAISAGTNSFNSGTVNFSNANGVTFGMDAASNLTASVAAGAANIGISAGTNSTNASTVNFSNSNGISFGMNTNAVITASYTVPTQSNQTLGLYATGNTTENSSTTLDARTLSFNFHGAVTGGFSNGSIEISVPVQSAQTQSLIQAFYDGANSITTGTVRLTNANGVSFSINGQTLSASVAAQTNQTIGLYATGNTTQNSSTTLDARSLSFNFLGAISGGYSNGSIDLSVPTQGATGAFTAGMNTDGNTAGTTGGVSLSMEFVGGSNITLSQSINGNSGTLSIIGAAGGGGNTISNFYWPEIQVSALSTVNSLGGFAQYVPIPNNLSMTRACIFESFSNPAPVNSAATFGATLSMGLYTLNGSTLSALTTNTQTYSITWSSNSTSSVNGVKLMSVPLSSVLTPGEYWVIISQSSSSSNVGVTVNAVGLSKVNQASVAPFGSASNITYGIPLGQGQVTEAWGNSHALSNISQANGNMGNANFAVQLGATSVWG